MLTQLYTDVSRKFRFVNATLLAAVSVAAFGAIPINAQAFVAEDTIVQTVHSVKFTRGDVATPNGLKAVYAKMSAKASKACASGYNINDMGERISQERCASDLLTQFVENANIDELTAFHKKKLALSKTASLN